MAGRKHYKSHGRSYGKSRGGGSRTAAPAPAAPAGPERSAAMQAVFAEAERVDREAATRTDDGVAFRMKPKAVRRFERYAGGG